MNFIKALSIYVFCLILTHNSYSQTQLPPFPAIPERLPIDSVPMGDWQSFPEFKLDIPIAEGPFEPNWESIEKNYPGEPAWLREAKFGIWVHFGPQSRSEEHTSELQSRQYL